VSQGHAGSSGSSGSASGGQDRIPAGATQDVDERPPAPGIDIEKPHVARMYDYFLGGKNNYAADREAAEQVLKGMPEVRIGAQTNRRLLIESVRWLAQEAGIRQFLDIGSGLPTQQNVHEVAQSVDENARVVYVDNDPLVRVHAESLLARTPNTIVVEGDLREPEALLERPELREHLDFTRPMALLLVAVLHFIEDTQRAYEIARTLYDALPSGSYVVLSHALTNPVIEKGMEHTRAIYSRTNSGGYPRTMEQIQGFFTGLTPVGSGLAHATEWSLPGRPPGLMGDGSLASVGDPSTLKSLPVIFGVARVDR
jgi:Protein of unknown function (DUF574).